LIYFKYIYIFGQKVIGAFVDGEVKGIMNMQEQETPVYIMAVGRKG